MMLGLVRRQDDCRISFDLICAQRSRRKEFLMPALAAGVFSCAVEKTVTHRTASSVRILQDLSP